MQYRLAGASYRAIAEKLTEERAQAYADEHGVSFERAMKKFPHVSKRTVWDDVTAELEELRREPEVQRADLMALENARLDQVFSKALSLFANGSVPAGRLAIATMGRRCLICWREGREDGAGASRAPVGVDTPPGTPCGTCEGVSGLN